MRRIIMIATLMAALSASADKSQSANTDPALTCYPDGSDDRFQLYPEQQVYAGRLFSIYQLIDGLTVLVFNHQTRRFNRLTNLNLLPYSSLDPQRAPEPIQFFSGYCDLSPG